MRQKRKTKLTSLIAQKSFEIGGVQVQEAPPADVTAPEVLSATVSSANPDELVVVFSESVNITNTTGLTLSGDLGDTVDATAPTVVSATVSDANPDELVVVLSEAVNITNATGLSLSGTLGD